jgi:hypothetical protein
MLKLEAISGAGQVRIEGQMQEWRIRGKQQWQSRVDRLNTDSLSANLLCATSV